MIQRLKWDLILLVLVSCGAIGCVEGDGFFETEDGDIESRDTANDEDTLVDDDSETDTFRPPYLDSDEDVPSDTHTAVETDTGDEVCGAEDFTIEAVPSRIMILQDISGSMQDNAGWGSSKWTQAKQALTSMLNRFKGQLEFGFDAFPRNGACGPGAKVVIDSQFSAALTIIRELPGIYPSGSTPLLASMRKFQKSGNAPRFLSRDATSYLIIVSDGDDTCAGGIFGMGATSQQLRTASANLLKQMGVRTYVIGFGNGASPQKLNAIAAAGGTGRKKFINAMNTQELTNALNQIGSSVVSCVYDLSEQTSDDVDLNKANFYLDDVVVGRDDGCANGHGWQWANGERTRVEFCEEACARLQSGEVSKISVTFGCETVVVL